MRNRWIGKNVDLTLLCERIEDFSKAREFRVRRTRLTKGYEILWIPKYPRNLVRGVTVKIHGDPDDFTIDFCGKEYARASTMFGRITTLFGGGILVLPGLKSQEAQEKLEKQFWAYVEETIANLVDSALKSGGPD